MRHRPATAHLFALLIVLALTLAGASPALGQTNPWEDGTEHSTPAPPPDQPPPSGGGSSGGTSGGEQTGGSSDGGSQPAAQAPDGDSTAPPAQKTPSEPAHPHQDKGGKPPAKDKDVGMDQEEQVWWVAEDTAGRTSAAVVDQEPAPVPGAAPAADEEPLPPGLWIAVGLLGLLAGGILMLRRGRILVSDPAELDEPPEAVGAKMWAVKAQLQEMDGQPQPWEMEREVGELEEAPPPLKVEWELREVGGAAAASTGGWELPEVDATAPPPEAAETTWALDELLGGEDEDTTPRPAFTDEELQRLLGDG